MRAEDLILVSVDDRVIEPPNMFDGRLPAKYADRAPKSPPQYTWPEYMWLGSSCASQHRSLTLPSMSYRPKPFGRFSPTG